MNNNQMKKRYETKILTLSAVLTAIVVILQFMGAFIRFGMFSISLVLVPIVIGAALCGVGVGAWLGLIFGVVVLISGDAAAFLAINPIGTVITVLTKGILCGLSAGLVYKLLERVNKVLAVFAAALICPIVNTGVFLVGCMVFFLDTIKEWAAAGNFGYAIEYMIIGLVGGNFLFEIAVNMVLSPVVTKLLNIKLKLR